MALIPAIPLMQITCFVDHSMSYNDATLQNTGADTQATKLPVGLALLPEQEHSMWQLALAALPEQEHSMCPAYKHYVVQGIYQVFTIFLKCTFSNGQDLPDISCLPF